jgi:hypothetical protein
VAHGKRVSVEIDVHVGEREYTVSRGMENVVELSEAFELAARMTLDLARDVPGFDYVGGVRVRASCHDCGWSSGEDGGLGWMSCRCERI